MKLTDAEREALLNQMILEYGEDKQTWRELGSFRRLSNVVESIVAARLAEQQEALAAAIEDARDLSRVGSSPFVDFGGNVGWLDHEWDDAARIVREYQPREDT